jgi:hypothetical protein
VDDGRESLPDRVKTLEDAIDDRSEEPSLSEMLGTLSKRVDDLEQSSPWHQDRVIDRQSSRCSGDERTDA